MVSSPQRGREKRLSVTCLEQALVKFKGALGRSALIRGRRLVRADVFAEVGLTSEAFMADIASERNFIVGCAVLVLVRLLHQVHSGADVFRDRPRLVPPPMRGEIRWAVEDFVALGTAVLHVDDSRATMLRQGEGIFIHLLAEFADVVADLVLDLRQLRLSLFRDLDEVERRVNIALTDD